MLRFKLHHLFALSLLVTTLCSQPAQAMEVNFELVSKPTPAKTTVAASPDLTSARPNFQPQTSKAAVVSTFRPLPIPPAASQPPSRVTPSTKALPRNVIASARILKPPPAAALPTTRVLEPNTPPLPSKVKPAPIGLNFTPAHPVAASPPPQPLASTPQQPDLPKWIYQGGSNSLVARVIGSAEGTRTTSGQPTRAYYGHTDPGNGVWNMGTFSYQHGASSPNEADRKQLQRLQRQGKKIAHQANQAELDMSLGEILNGLDLANQSPRAALEQGGYIDRLAQAKQQGMKNGDAIVWARTYSYLDPQTQRWNAPGLGNTLPSIRRDQNRRHEAVARAFAHYQAQRAEPTPDTLAVPALAMAQQPADTVAPSSPKTETPEKITDKQQQAQPLNFKIAESLAPNHQPAIPHSQNATSAPTLTSDTELSVTTDGGSSEDGSPDHVLSETETVKIHS